MEQQSTDGDNYGKRPLWQWVFIYLVLAVIVYGLIYYFIFKQKRDYTTSAPQENSQANQSAPQPTSQASAPETASENVVTYTNSGFSPSVLKVKAGTTVTFANKASDSMWVASAIHPTHRSYPTTGGCIGSTFDSCKNIARGSSWAFIFDIKGTWKYHNHLDPKETGTIVVE